ncbi:MAG: 4Fe-4S dicluster domain-containing protein [Halioglobus sp.]|nr:4Fe-4S dicluster domain-containing protein [Halioglobus sp.]
MLRVKYPQGAEKMLVQALLGREVPAGGLPLDVGVVVVNVATAAEIGHLLPDGQGIQERVITDFGAGRRRQKGQLPHPDRHAAALRTRLRRRERRRDPGVIRAGPMMGAALPSLDLPITKGTSGFIAFTSRETGRRPPVYPCINCGYCVDACPLFLNPAHLGLLARNGRHEEAARDFHLMDCFECGSCAYVCPSHLPLVQTFRAAKRSVREDSKKP